MVRHSYSYTKAYVIFKDKLRDARGHSSTCHRGSICQEAANLESSQNGRDCFGQERADLNQADGIQGCIMQTLRTTWGERRQTLRDELWSLEMRIKV